MAFKKKLLNAEDVGQDKLMSVNPNTFGGAENKQPIGGAGVGATGDSKGTFNKEKNEFTDTKGKVYPTSNPDFRPDPNAEQITFKQGGGVEIIPVGSTTPIQLTREEYNVTQGGAGNVTNPVKAVQQAQTPQNPAQQLQTPTTEQIQGAAQGQDFRGTAIAPVLSATAQALSTLSDFLPSSLRFSEAKSTEVKKAEAGFASVSATIADDIKLYQAGQMDLASVQKDIDRATKTIIALQQQTKSQGQINLRFWLDQGAEIEAQVQEEIRSLENQKRLLGL